MNKPVLCIGELLIDFTSMDVNATIAETSNFQKNAGGAPANVAAAISKLGGRAFFAGCVGADPFGDYLEQTLVREGVDCRLLQRDSNHNTTLAFVSLTQGGERDFSFVRGADQYFQSTADLEDCLSQVDLVHFGSATGFLGDPFEGVYGSLMEAARSQGKLISFDPNYRDALFGPRNPAFIEKAQACLGQADLVKVSEEELFLLTGHADRQAGLDALKDLGADHVLVTLGSQGVVYASKGKQIEVATPPIEAKDSTGAGDAFVGGVLYRLGQMENPVDTLNDLQVMAAVLTFACGVGASTCLGFGAIPSLPTLDQVHQLLAENR